METCYVPVILNVLIDSFFFFARYQKSILETSSLLWNLLVFLCGKLKMRGQYHIDKRQDIYHNLQVAENSGEERSYLKSRFYLHLHVDKSQEM